MDDDQVRGTLRELFPAASLTRDDLRRFTLLADTLIDSRPASVHPLLDYFEAAGRLYLLEPPLPPIRLRERMGRGDSPVADVELLVDRLTDTLARLSALDPPFYHGGLEDDGVRFARGQDSPVLVNSRQFVELIDGSPARSREETCRRDLSALAGIAVELLTGATRATSRAIADLAQGGLLKNAVSAPLLEWLCEDAEKLPVDIAALTTFRDHVRRGFAAAASTGTATASNHWPAACAIYNSRIVSGWLADERTKPAERNAAKEPPVTARRAPSRQLVRESTRAKRLPPATRRSVTAEVSPASTGVLRWVALAMLFMLIALGVAMMSEVTWLSR